MRLYIRSVMFRKKDKTPLDTEFDRTILALDDHEPNSEEYAKILEIASQLHKMKKEESSPVSGDTLLLVAANLLGIIMIIRHENVNVITSRAMNLILKPKS
jgi:hypothetical protein